MFRGRTERSGYEQNFQDIKGRIRPSLFTRGSLTLKSMDLASVEGRTGPSDLLINVYFLNLERKLVYIERIMCR